MYRYIEPEVSGGLGQDTQLDSKVHPPIIEKLHFEFSGWLGDDIIESFPCFIVTERLRKRIEFEKLTGITFENVIISKSEVFLQIYPTIQLPNFYWAKIDGTFGKDDFIIGDDNRLVISERTFKILKLFKISNAIVEEIEES